MTTRTVKIAMLAVPAAGLVVAVGATGAQASKPIPDHKVTLCHRTGSVDGGNQHNGYDVITVDIASVANAKDARGHDSHDQIGNGPGGDIIPSYTYGDFTYPGKNLANGGAAFLANGCHAVTPSPSPTLTPTPTASPTATPTSSPTPVPSTTTPPPVVIIHTPPPQPIKSPPPVVIRKRSTLPFTGDYTSQEALFGFALLSAGYGFVRLGRA